MHHGPAQALIQMEEALAAEPVGDAARLRRGQERIEGVAGIGRMAAVEDCQEVQVVIAQHRDDAAFQGQHMLHQGQRIRPSVHQVSQQPEAILGRVERDRPQQFPEFRIAALNVADRVSGHRRYRARSGCEALAFFVNPEPLAVPLAAAGWQDGESRMPCRLPATALAMRTKSATES